MSLYSRKLKRPLIEYHECWDKVVKKIDYPAPDECNSYMEDHDMLLLKIGCRTPDDTLKRGLRSTYRIRPIPREEAFLSLGPRGARRSPSFGYFKLETAFAGLGPECLAEFELFECCKLGAGEWFPLGFCAGSIDRVFSWKAFLLSWTRYRVGEFYMWRVTARVAVPEEDAVFLHDWTIKQGLAPGT